MTPEMRAQADRIGHEAMQQIYRSIPWGEVFKVGGLPCRIVEMNGVSGKSEPKITLVDPDCTSPVKIGKPPGPNAYTQVRMIFDVVPDGHCEVDHVELCISVSGGGGFVANAES